MAGFEWNVSSQRVGAGCGRAQPSCKALDRGSTGVHTSMARGAPPGNLGLPVSSCVLCSSIPGEVWSSECQNAGQTSRKAAASLGSGHLFTEVQGGEGAGLSSPGKSGLQTPGARFSYGAGLWGCAHVLTLPLSPAGHLCAAGPSVGFCADLHLLGGESAPGTSQQPPLGRGLGPNWWW